MEKKISLRKVQEDGHWTIFYQKILLDPSALVCTRKQSTTKAKAFGLNITSK